MLLSLASSHVGSACGGDASQTPLARETTRMETNNQAPEHRRGFCPQARVAAVPLAPNILTWDLTGGNRQVGVYGNLTSWSGRINVRIGLLSDFSDRRQ